MSVIESIHEDRGASFGERAGRRVVEHYGRPERAHRAVRNAVGIWEPAYGIVVVSGDDRVEYVDNVVTNRVPSEDGEGCYALVLDAQGRIEEELSIYNAGERLLLFTAPDRAGALAAEWSEKVFIQDVEIRVATDEFGVFGIHGPTATEKIASVLNGAASPERSLSFVRGRMDSRGVSVIRTDGLAGEEGYDVVCGVEDAESVYDTLANRGLNAAPFGYRSWDTLTLEAGTPLYESELKGRIPNVAGVRSALDFEKGCYVGQEVVSRVENRGQPSKRLVGLTLPGSAIPESGAAVLAGDAAVGTVTRAAESPLLETPIALAAVEFSLEETALRVRIDGAEVDAERVELPFVEGSDRSGRLPQY